MATRISTAARSAAADAVAALVNGGSGPGVLRVYTGTQPAGPGSSATGTLLVECTLSDPAFAAAVAGSAALDVTPAVSGTAVADGTAGWWRLADSDGNGVIDGSVTATGGGGDLTLATTTITTGLTVTVAAGSITAPAS